MSAALEATRVLEAWAGRVHAALDAAVPEARGARARLHELMRYSLLAGGKRLRPALCLASCEAAAGDPDDAMPFAVALELVHTYSLIHDDLPCMDDDEERRGRPTVHVAFGEAVALLAGDALLAEAFEVLASAPSDVEPERRLAVLREVANALPSDRLLVETDAPLLSPQGFRGKRNEPAHVRSVGEALAETQGRPAEEVARETAENTRRLFRLP